MPYLSRLEDLIEAPKVTWMRLLEYFDTMIDVRIFHDVFASHTLTPSPIVCRILTREQHRIFRKRDLICILAYENSRSCF